MMELIKMDIAKVISKYMKIDADNMEIQINTKGNKLGRGGKMPSLYAHIPIVDVAANQDVVSK
jgi:cell division topological specificity factor